MGIEVKNTLYYKKYRYSIDFGLLNKDEVDVSPPVNAKTNGQQ